MISGSFLVGRNSQAALVKFHVNKAAPGVQNYGGTCLSYFDFILFCRFKFQLSVLLLQFLVVVLLDSRLIALEILEMPMLNHQIWQDMIGEHDGILKQLVVIFKDDVLNIASGCIVSGNVVHRIRDVESSVFT